MVSPGLYFQKLQVFSGVNLLFFRVKRKKEKTLVMTGLYRESNPDHYTR